MTDAFTKTARGLDVMTAAQLGDLFHALSHNPKTRKTVAKAIKEVADDLPDAKQHLGAFRDVDIEERQAKWEEEQAAKELEKQRQAVLDRMNQQRQRLLDGDESGRKYSADELKGIESLMQERGLTDYSDGAILYSAKNPPANPQPSNEPPVHGTTWEFPEWSTFGKDPVRASRQAANQVITEFMKKR